MQFEEKVRLGYRVALHAARKNDVTATLAALVDFHNLLQNQFELDNGDGIVAKAKLSYYSDKIADYIEIVRKNGLKDSRIRDFFGLDEEYDGVSLPTEEDGGETPVSPQATAGGIDISGIAEPSVPTEEPAGDVPETEPEPEDIKEPEVPETEPEPVINSETQVPETPIANPVPSEENGGSDRNVPTFTPDSLEHFIGQQHIVKVLLKEIAIAKAQGIKHIDNILLLGNPGLGKTTLMGLIAKSLGVRFELLDCTHLKNDKKASKALQNFLKRIERDNEPVVIAFDEIHSLPDGIQEELLTFLNERVYKTSPDANGVIDYIRIDDFTFIAATTDDDKVLRTIKDRCLRLKFQMTDYSPEELKLIYRNKIAAKGLTITDEAIDSCIPRSRGSIRYVNSFVDGLNTALYDDNGCRMSSDIDLAVVTRYFEERGIDEIGLEKKDIEILNAIASDPSGAVSEDTLAARVGLDAKKYASEYEPYLLKIGLISKTNRGRSLTEKAINHLKGELI